jgi:hypothetical protein
MSKNHPACLWVAGAFLALGLTSQSFAQSNRKSTPTTPPLQSLAASQAMPSPPTGTLRLRHLGTANDGPARIWIEEAGLKRTGQTAVLWVLQALPADQMANGQAVAGSWAFMKLDCATGTAAARRAVIINASGATLLDSGTLPERFERPQTESTPAKLVQVVCNPPPANPSVPLLRDAQSAVQAIAWTRNPSLGTPTSQTAAQTDGRSIGLPSGPLALKDLMIDQDKTEGFFTYYTTPGHLMASRTENIWVLMVSATDRSFTLNGRTIAAAARWTNWVSNCDRNALTIRAAGLVDADGRITSIPAQSLPRTTDVLLAKRRMTAAQMPNEPEAQTIFDKMCPDDSLGIMSGMFKTGFQPVTYTTASAAIQASRRARNLTLAERTTAISCLALTYSTQSLADEMASEPWASLAMKAELSIFASALREAVGAEHVTRAALMPARERFAAMVTAAKTTKDMTNINRELDQCIAALPIGLMPGQFSD